MSPSQETAERLLAGEPVDASPVSFSHIPARSLVVVTCMDVRVDPLPLLGLEPGDAHVVRNAGAKVTEDVLRSIETSRTLMGTTDVLLVGHSKCGAYASAEDTKEALAEGLSRLPGRAAAAFYDLDSGRLEPVTSRT